MRLVKTKELLQLFRELCGGKHINLTFIILPLILEILHIPHTEQQQYDCNRDREEIRSGAGVPPNKWEPHLIQDSALYILVNLSITPSARAWLRREDTVVTLRNIASYSAASRQGSMGGEETEEELEVKEKQKGIQCLKAVSVLFFFLLFHLCVRILFETSNLSVYRSKANITSFPPRFLGPLRPGSYITHDP